VEYPIFFMKALELKKQLAAKGCRFETHRGGSGHLTVIRGKRKSQLLMHGQKELGAGLVTRFSRIWASSDARLSDQAHA
jgi:mRNA interferase HicA